MPEKGGRICKRIERFSCQAVTFGSSITPRVKPSTNEAACADPWLMGNLVARHWLSLDSLAVDAIAVRRRSLSEAFIYSGDRKMKWQQQR